MVGPIRHCRQIIFVVSMPEHVADVSILHGFATPGLGCSAFGLTAIGKNKYFTSQICSNWKVLKSYTQKKKLQYVVALSCFCFGIILRHICYISLHYPQDMRFFVNPVTIEHALKLPRYIGFVPKLKFPKQQRMS